MKKTEKIEIETYDFTNIVEKAKVLRDQLTKYGDRWSMKINRKQPEGKIIKLTRLDRYGDGVFVRHFFKLTDFIDYLAGGKGRHLYKHEKLALETPKEWRDEKYIWISEFVDNKFGTKLYLLDVSKLVNHNENVSYWIDEKNNVYRYLKTQDRYTLRNWQVRKSGSRWLNFSGNTINEEDISKYINKEVEGSL